LKAINNNNSERVQEFYNENTEKFLAVYGDIIQAFRTLNITDYLSYTIKSAGILPGMKVLDAGCGVCGPAIYFAENILDIQIDACTISDVQFNMAKKNIADKDLGNSITPHLLDYHTIASRFGNEAFDMIYFLESFGHSTSKMELIDACWKVLRPGGKLYIKDLFKRISNDDWEQLRIDEICTEINTAYEYDIPDLSSTLNILRSVGLELRTVKVPEIEIDQFEKLTISNTFQNLFNIGKINGWDEYIFPIDFYELILTKPKDLKPKNMHLYSLNKP